jgi:glycosyltransferase involved in cell wall biosynthesis
MTLEQSRTNASTNGSLAKLAAANGSANGHSRAASHRSVRVSVVIPARNEAENLPYVLERIPAWVHEVILVDGLSVDDTVSVARANLPEIRIVHQTGRGKGNALREGFQAATGDFIVALDADGSMDPKEIDRFVDLFNMGFDFVKGSRMLPGGSSEDLTFFRRFGNWAFRTMTNALTGSRYTDLCYGYFGIRRAAVDHLDLRADGFEIETEINIRAYRAGLRTGEVPSSEFVRHNGTSQLSAFKDGMRILFTIFYAGLGRQTRANSDVTSASSGVRPGMTARAHVSLEPEVDGQLPRDTGF